jgi:hypothetical protein
VGWIVVGTLVVGALIMAWAMGTVTGRADEHAQEEDRLRRAARQRADNEMFRRLTDHYDDEDNEN